MGIGYYAVKGGGLAWVDESADPDGGFPAENGDSAHEDLSRPLEVELNDLIVHYGLDAVWGAFAELEKERKNG